MINFNDLKKPFPVSSLKWRIGNKNREGTKANMLVYVDARMVQDRLDEVVGAGNWQFETRSMNSVNRQGNTFTIIGRLGIKINDEWIWKEDGAENSDIEAAKGGISDAFKRAAVQWGIGRYLYNASDYSTWAEVKSNDFNIYQDNKRLLDTVAWRLTLRAYDETNSMEDFFSTLRNSKQAEFIAKLNEEMFGDKYKAQAVELIMKLGD
ncbi:MAG: Rad52/Rad22 family DNA repair protein [Candidatus Enterosoma sp.]|nr:Rad52/Rad22 family DNA repair protein [Candidatus Enterosoma sp.]